MLLQTAIASTTSPDPLGGHLVQAAVILLLALQGWSVRALLAATREIATFRQTLFGETGDNGINGTQKEHGKCLDEHEKQLAHHAAYIENTVPERLKTWEAFREQVWKEIGTLRKACHDIRNEWQAKQHIIARAEDDQRNGYGRRQSDRP